MSETMKTETVGNYQLRWDGQNVWIDDVIGSVGRFGPTGYDYNNRIIAGGSTIPKGATLREWGEFVHLAKSLFGITLEARHRPTWLPDGSN